MAAAAKHPEDPGGFPMFIPVERMREANLMVDRDTDKASPKDAARFLAKALHLPGS